MTKEKITIIEEIESDIESIEGKQQQIQKDEGLKKVKQIKSEFAETDKEITQIQIRLNQLTMKNVDLIK